LLRLKLRASETATVRVLLLISLIVSFRHSFRPRTYNILTF